MRKIFRKSNILLLVLFLLIARGALPEIIREQLNRKMKDMGDYKGHIEDIDMAFYRGAYTIENFTIEKLSGKKYIPFFSAKEIDLSVLWKQLLHGAIVGEIVADGVRLNFVDDKEKDNVQDGAGTNWKEKINQFFPVKIDKIVIHNGSVNFHQYSSDPEVHIALSSIYFRANNLTNSLDLSKDLVSDIVLQGTLFNDTDLVIEADYNPFAKDLYIDLDAEVSTFDLKKVNDFARVYGGFDFEKGTLAMSSEIVAKNGNISGYIKPVMKDVDIVSWKGDIKEDDDGLLHTIKESLVGAGAEIFENQSRDQLAGKVPFEGRLDEVDTKKWKTFVSILRNAFVNAINPTVDNSLELKSE